MKKFPVRLLIVLIIGLLYVIVLRPARGMISYELIMPMAEKQVDKNPEMMVLFSSPDAKSFVIYFLTHPEAETSTGITFTFPFDFFLFAPLLFLILVRRKNQSLFIKIHILIQVLLGVLRLGFFYSGLKFHTSFFYMYHFISTYLLQGAAFLIVLFYLMNNNKLIDKE